MVEGDHSEDRVVEVEAGAVVGEEEREHYLVSPNIVLTRAAQDGQLTYFGLQEGTCCFSSLSIE